MGNIFTRHIPLTPAEMRLLCRILDERIVDTSSNITAAICQRIKRKVLRAFAQTEKENRQCRGST